MQTILGSGGAVGIELAKALTSFTKDIRLVSRHPKKINESDQIMSADLKDAQSVMKAVEGSDVSYLVVGLEYNTKVWQNDWPLIMQNVISACAQYKCKLVFFDNIYLYDGKNLNPIKETNSINSPSKKGKVREEIANMIWQAVSENKIEALIARSADFYGPDCKSSILIETVFKPLSQGKKANLLVSDQFRHSFTFTPDAAKATAILGNTPEAFGKIWHMPTTKEALTGKEWVNLIANELNVKPQYRVVGKAMVWIMGLFMPVMRESYEMLYQYDKDYVFDSSKFDSEFSYSPVSNPDGVKSVIQSGF